MSGPLRRSATRGGHSGLTKTWARQRAAFSAQRDQKQVGPRDCPAPGNAFYHWKRDAQERKNAPTSWQGQPSPPGSVSFLGSAGESVSPGARGRSVPTKFISA